MKKIVFLLIFMCATLSGFAQDIKYENGMLMLTVKHTKVVQDGDRFIYSGDILELKARNFYDNNTTYRLCASKPIYNYIATGGKQNQQNQIGTAGSGKLVFHKTDSIVTLADSVKNKRFTFEPFNPNDSVHRNIMYKMARLHVNISDTAEVHKGDTVNATIRFDNKLWSWTGVIMAGDIVVSDTISVSNEGSTSAKIYIPNVGKQDIYMSGYFKHDHFPFSDKKQCFSIEAKELENPTICQQCKNFWQEYIAPYLLQIVIYCIVIIIIAIIFVETVLLLAKKRRAKQTVPVGGGESAAGGQAASTIDDQKSGESQESVVESNTGDTKKPEIDYAVLLQEKEDAIMLIAKELGLPSNNADAEQLLGAIKELQNKVNEPKIVDPNKKEPETVGVEYKDAVGKIAKKFNKSEKEFMDAVSKDNGVTPLFAAYLVTQVYDHVNNKQRTLKEYISGNDSDIDKFFSEIAKEINKLNTIQNSSFKDLVKNRFTSVQKEQLVKFMCEALHEETFPKDLKADDFKNYFNELSTFVDNAKTTVSPVNAVDEAAEQKRAEELKEKLQEEIGKSVFDEIKNRLNECLDCNKIETEDKNEFISHIADLLSSAYKTEEEISQKAEELSREKIAAANECIGKLTEEKDNLQGQLNDATSKNTELGNKLDEVNKQNEQFEKDIATANESIGKLTEEKGALQGQLDTANSNNTSLSKELGEVKKINKELSGANSQLEDDLNAERNKLKNEKSAHGETVTKLEAYLNAYIDNMRDIFARVSDFVANAAKDKNEKLADFIADNILENRIYGLTDFDEKLKKLLKEARGKNGGVMPVDDVKQKVCDAFESCLSETDPTWIDMLARLYSYTQVDFLNEAFVKQGLDTKKIVVAFQSTQVLLGMLGIEITYPELFYDVFDQDIYKHKAGLNITGYLPGIEDEIQSRASEGVIVDLRTVGYKINGEIKELPVVAKYY